MDLGPSAALDGLLGELRELGAEPLPLHGDMGTTDAPARVVGEAAERFGGLDGLVSNAGVNRPGPLVSYSVEDWDRLFAVNTRATWLLAKAAHPALKASGGAIVVVGSMSGSNAHARPRRLRAEQGRRDHAGRVLAQEFGRDGIRVNSVSPGMVRTGMTAAVYADGELAAERDALVPLGRVATPEDIADVIAFLLGPDARYVNGHDLVVDGGVAGNYLGRLPRADPDHPRLTFADISISRRCYHRSQRGLRARACTNLTMNGTTSDTWYARWAIPAAPGSQPLRRLNVSETSSGVTSFATAWMPTFSESTISMSWSGSVAGSTTPEEYLESLRDAVLDGRSSIYLTDRIGAADWALYFVGAVRRAWRGAGG